MVNIPMMEAYLETLAGYVHDEDKLVTYKWLSKELEVHVNVAKIILWRYLENHRGDELVATYMLIGNLKGGGMRVEVVRDVDLDRARDKFEKIISEHVYSLQKSLTSIGLLAGSDRGDSRYSAIKCDRSVLLSGEELARLRWGKAGQNIPNDKKDPDGAKKNLVGEKKDSVGEKKNTIGENKNTIGEKRKTIGEKKNPVGEKKSPVSDKKSSEEDKDFPKTADQGSVESKSDEKVKKISPTAKPKVEKKGAASKKPVQSTKAGYGNLFGKALNHQKSSDGPKKPIAQGSGDSPEEKSARSVGASSDGAESASKSEEASKISETPKISDTLKIPEVSKVPKAKEKPKERTKSPSRPSEKVSKEKASKKKSGDSSKKQKATRGKKRERSEDSGRETKKRKRIFVASDSSSEDSPEPSDQEDMFESPPEPPKRERSPSPPAQGEPNRRKARKTVDKTFVDEDGFCVTKKVQVYESCSEEEAELDTRKQPEPEVPKETNNKPSPVKKKQTTLMNFFKKA